MFCGGVLPFWRPRTIGAQSDTNRTAKTWHCLHHPQSPTPRPSFDSVHCGGDAKTIPDAHKIPRFLLSSCLRTIQKHNTERPKPDAHSILLQLVLTPGPLADQDPRKTRLSGISLIPTYPAPALDRDLVDPQSGNHMSWPGERQIIRVSRCPLLPGRREESGRKADPTLQTSHAGHAHTAFQQHATFETKQPLSECCKKRALRKGRVVPPLDRIVVASMHYRHEESGVQLLL